MFCDSSNLQLLCGECHKVKSVEEVGIAKERRRRAKEEQQFEDEDFTIEEE
jgi:hypothetical protein